MTAASLEYVHFNKSCHLRSSSWSYERRSFICEIHTQRIFLKVNLLKRQSFQTWKIEKYILLWSFEPDIILRSIYRRIHYPPSLICTNGCYSTTERLRSHEVRVRAARGLVAPATLSLGRRDERHDAELARLRRDRALLRQRLEDTEWSLCQRAGEIALLKTQLKDAQVYRQEI